MSRVEDVNSDFGGYHCEVHDETYPKRDWCPKCEIEYDLRQSTDGRRIGQDDLDECWCCGGLHDGAGSLCPNCTDAGCGHFAGECKSDHKPVLPDGGHRLSTDRVDGTILAECPNKDSPDDGHLSATVEYGETVDNSMYEEFIDAFETCGECGAELDYIAQEEPTQVLD